MWVIPESIKGACAIVGMMSIAGLGFREVRVEVWPETPAGGAEGAREPISEAGEDPRGPVMILGHMLYLHALAIT